MLHGFALTKLPKSNVQSPIIYEAAERKIRLEPTTFVADVKVRRA